jgi:hypothetical protein
MSATDDLNRNKMEDTHTLKNSVEPQTIDDRDSMTLVIYSANTGVEGSKHSIGDTELPENQLQCVSVVAPSEMEVKENTEDFLNIDRLCMRNPTERNSRYILVFSHSFIHFHG